MGPPVFIGNELTAAAFRLAGLEAIGCDPDAARMRFEEHIAGETRLLLVGQSCVAAIGAERLSAAAARADPAVLVVADVPGEGLQDELPDSIRRELGVMQ